MFKKVETTPEEREVYRQAAARIRKDGWLQGEFGNPYDNLPVCIGCAIMYPIDSNNRIVDFQYLTWDSPLIHKAFDATGANPYDHLKQPLAQWNDDPNRTLDEVLGLLDHLSQE